MQYIVYIAFEGQRLQISIGDWAKDMEKSNLWPVKHIAIFYFARFDNGTHTLTTITKVTFCNMAHFSPYKKVQKLANEGHKGQAVLKAHSFGHCFLNPKVL